MPPAEKTKPVHRVVAGVLFNAAGKVLLASRPADKSFSGYWEFPGGKIEAGESAFAALQRELDEEIGISVRHAHPWLTMDKERADVRILLQFWRIAADEWSGNPTPLEGQILAWQNPATPTVAPMLPGNTPILHALTIPTLLSGSLNNGLQDKNGQWRALPTTRRHLNPDAALLIDADALNDSVRPPFWAIVRRREQWLQVQDAATVIWAGNTAELTALLDEGVSLPVLAVHTDPAERAALRAAGIHGFIHDNSPTTETA